MGRRDKMEEFEERNDSKHYIILSVITIIFLVIMMGLRMITPDKEVTPKINNDALEIAVKNALITMAEDEFGAIEKDGTKYAEGHKVLRSEKNGEKFYAYTVAEYGIYEEQAADNTEKPTPVSATTCPMVLVFTAEEFENTDNDKKNNKEVKYVYYVSYKVQGKDESKWEESLEMFFPMDLVDAAKVDYADDFYQNQIRAYLVVEDTNITENQNENE